jgi:hypothetical protein
MDPDAKTTSSANFALTTLPLMTQSMRRTVERNPRRVNGLVAPRRDFE